MSGRLRVVRSAAALREQLAPARRHGSTIGLVPTMGAFHEGHLSLMRHARAECDVVVVSLFVNPTQFTPGEDLDAYPSDRERDTELARDEGVDLLFVPAIEDVYPDAFATTVEVAGLTDVLCGAPSSRGAQHFHGVTTVVAKLLNVCAPDRAYFGQKDFQQLRVIERMVHDLDFPVEIVACPIVRELDGLAMSSRNAYLDPDGRERATALKRALDAAAAVTAQGGAPAAVRGAAIAELEAAGITPEYVEIRRADDLSPLADLAGERIVVAIAATVGHARLIDNTVIDMSAGKADGRAAATAAVA